MTMTGNDNNDDNEPPLNIDDVVDELLEDVNGFGARNHHQREVVQQIGVVEQQPPPPQEEGGWILGGMEPDDMDEDELMQVAEAAEIAYNLGRRDRRVVIVNRRDDEILAAARGGRLYEEDANGNIRLVVPVTPSPPKAPKKKPKKRGDDVVDKIKPRRLFDDDEDPERDQIFV